MKKRDKYTEVYLEYFNVVFNTIYTKVGNQDISEDLCQEVFIILYNKFEEVENQKAWLYITTRNVIMKYFRDKKSHVDIDEVFGDVALTFVNGFKDSRIMLKEAIDVSIKDDDERMLVDLIAYHNYTYQYVARTMGLTRKKVVYRYNKIVERVIDYLRSQGIKDLEELLQ